MGQIEVGRWQVGEGSQLEYARFLHETLFVPVLMYGNETMLWKERFRIRAVQRDNLGGLVAIRRMNRVLIRDLCVLPKGLMMFFGTSAMWRK